MITMREMALAKAQFCMRWAARDPQHAETHKRHAESWRTLYLAL
jgi:hypothetical protein